MTPDEIRFAADAMLQSLATWLRLMGYDCLTPAEAHASATGKEKLCSGGVSRGSRVLLEQAVAEQRLFLTRNAHLADNLPRALLERAEIYRLRAGQLPAQLRELAGKFCLDTDRYLFSRCLRCNRPLQPLERSQARGRVPADVLAREQQFWQCPHCGKAFWRGSHVHNSRARLERWLAATASS
jgi:uncharacterized protein with PIN domain